MASHNQAGKRPFKAPELVVYGSLLSRTKFKCPHNVGGMNEVNNDSFPKGSCGGPTKPSAKKTQ